MNARTPWRSAAIIALAIAGCGGSSANVPACGAFPTACTGGSIVGSWVQVEVCPPASTTDCPGATVQIKKDPAFTFTFGSDLSLKAMTSPAEFIETLPNSCLNGGTCADRGTATNICTASASTCRCDENAPGSSATGTYSVSGGVLTLTSNQSVQANDYCVQNQFLFIRRQGESDVYAVFSKAAG